jgi:hypothetical protein
LEGQVQGTKEGQNTGLNQCVVGVMLYLINIKEFGSALWRMGWDPLSGLGRSMWQQQCVEEAGTRRVGSKEKLEQRLGMKT